MSGEWENLAPWWIDQVSDDPVFATDVVPLLEQIIPSRSGIWLDLGCGEGRMLRRLGGDVVGCDLALPLLRSSAEAAPAVQCRLPDLGWLRPESLDGAYAVLVLEHLANLPHMLAETHRVVRPGGALVVVANHPAFTATGAGPVVDLNDGEVLWRWGPYLDAAPTPTNVGGRTVIFYHRPIGRWLGAAAAAGWTLEAMEERGLSEAAIAAEPAYRDQDQFPRLVGWRWRR